MNDVTASDVAALNEVRRCTATAKTTGQRCQRECMPSAAVCVVHGSNGRVKRKAQAWQAVDKLVPLWQPDAPPVKDPVAKLQELGGLAEAAMYAAGAKVALLKEWDSYDKKGAAQLKGVVQLLLQLMRLCESILTTLAKLGLDERRVQLAEREAEAVVKLLDTVRDAAELQLSAAQRQAWDTVVDRELAAITAE